MSTFSGSGRSDHEAHVVPRADLIEHVTNEDCCCGPRCEPVEREDGTTGWLYVHHSMDGRERSEQ